MVVISQTVLNAFPTMRPPEKFIKIVSLSWKFDHFMIETLNSRD